MAESDPLVELTAASRLRQIASLSNDPRPTVAPEHEEEDALLGPARYIRLMPTLLLIARSSTASAQR